MATKEKKKEMVAELEALFAKTNVAIVADFSGYSVAEITQFRRKLDKDNAQCKIAKNTLITIASAKSAYAPLTEIAKGPTAIIMGFDDPAAPAKTTVQFIKSMKKGEVKGAVLEGRLISADEVKGLAELPSKEQLLSSIAGGLDSGARGIAGMLEAVIRDLALLIEEVGKKNDAA